MLDRLSPELLLEILELASLRTLSEEGYKQRARTLNSLCLVSRTLHELVQPMLWEVVQVKGRDGVDKLREAMKEKAFPDKTHTLIFDIVDDVGFANIVKNFPRLERLKLFNESNLALVRSSDLLSACTALRRLTISFGNLNFDRPLLFPHLIELSLHGISSTPESVQALLQPTVLPALEALAMSSFHDVSTGGTVFPSIPSAMLHQINGLQIEHNDVNLLPTEVRSSAVLKLVTIRRVVVSISNPPPFMPAEHCLSLYMDQWMSDPRLHIEAATAKAYLVNLLNGISSWSAAAALFLPFSLHPSSHIKPDLADVKQRILDVCAREQLEVVWRTDPFSAEDERTFSLEFLEYARRKKAGGDDAKTKTA